MRSALADQPADISHFEALRRSYVAMYNATKVAPPGELSADRMMCTVRIITTSPALRQAAVEYRPHAVNVELANRMGVDVDDRRLRLVASVWSSIVVTAMADLADEETDWEHIGVDDVVARLDSTFDEFIDVIGEIPQPA